MKERIRGYNKKFIVTVVALVAVLLAIVGALVGVYAATVQTMKSKFTISYAVGENVAAAVRTEYYAPGYDSNGDGTEDGVGVAHNDENGNKVTNTQGFVVFTPDEDEKTKTIDIGSFNLTNTSKQVNFYYTIENLNEAGYIEYNLTQSLTTAENVKITTYYYTGDVNTGDSASSLHDEGWTTAHINNVAAGRATAVKVVIDIVDLYKTAECEGDFNLSLKYSDRALTKGQLSLDEWIASREALTPITELYFDKYTSENADTYTGVDLASASFEKEVGEEGGASVKLYVVGTKAYVLSHEEIAFPVNSTTLFNGYAENEQFSIPNITKIEFSNIDTSPATTMQGMFSYCTKLTSLDVSMFDTTNVTSMNGMFGTCTVLEELVLGDLNTPSLTDMSHMFRESPVLKSVDLTNFETSNVTNMGTIFYNCTGLESVNMSGLDLRRATSLIQLFRGCSALQTVNMNGIRTENALDMSEMFYGCSSLSSLDVSSLDTQSCQSMINMFADCSSLSTLNLRNFDTSNVTNMYRMFDNCTNITSLDLSNFDTSNVENMYCMFRGCSKLAAITWPREVNCLSLMDASGMFMGCAALTSLDLSCFTNTQNISVMMAMFREMTSLKTLDLSSFNTQSVQNTQTMFALDAALETVYISENWDVSSVTAANSSQMFYGCSLLPNFTSTYIDKTRAYAGGDGLGYLLYKILPVGTLDKALWTANASDLTEVYFDSFTIKTAETYVVDGVNKIATPDSVVDLSTEQNKSIRLYKVGTVGYILSHNPIYFPADCSEMFYQLTTLENLKFNNINTQKVETMLKMFTYCSGLTALDVSMFDTSNVRNMGSMFTYCEKLESLDVSNFNTSKLTNMQGMFGAMLAIESIDISQWNTSRVTNMTAAFGWSSALKSVSLAGLDFSSVTTISNMFANCTALESVDLSGLDLSKVTDMSYLLQGCINLTNLNLDGIITTYTNEEGETVASLTNMEGMFAQCSALTTIDVSMFDTTNVTNMRGIFDKCKVTTLDISTWKFTENLTNMEAMFQDCVNLTSIIWPTSMTTISVNNMSLMLNRCTSLTSLDLSRFNTSSVTTMYAMFNGCSSLTTVDLSSFNTAKVTNMAYMFSTCSALTELDLSSFNTANVTNMKNMFSGCDMLTKVYVGDNWSTAKVTTTANGAGMFTGCTSLSGAVEFDSTKTDHTMATTAGYLTHINDKVVTTAGTLSSELWAEDKYDLTEIYFDAYTSETAYEYAIGAASAAAVVAEAETGANLIAGVSGIDISEEQNGSIMLYIVDTVGYVLPFHPIAFPEDSTALFGDISATNIVFQNINTSNVTAMGEMFAGCTGITSLDLSSFDTSNVTTIGAMFMYCEGLLEVDLSSFNTRFVTSIDWMFAGCMSLTTIYVGDDWVIRGDCSGGEMFAGCTSLVGAVAYDESCIDAGMANTTTGYLTYKATSGGEEAEGGTLTSNLLQENKEMITELYFDAYTSDTEEEYVVDGTNVIAGIAGNDISQEQNASIKLYIVGTIAYVLSHDTIYFPPYSADLFVGMKATSIVFKNVNTSKAVTMAYMFNNCSSLARLDLTSFDTSNVTNMQYMFQTCNNLTSLDLSSFNTSNVTNMHDMFHGCSSLTSLDLSSFNTSNVQHMRYMFNGCSSLTSLDLSSFDTSNVTNMQYMFQTCNDLTSLDLSSFNTANVTSMSYMFYSCSRLTTIYVGDGWATTSVTSSTIMFGGCTSLSGAVEFDSTKTDHTMATTAGYLTYKEN